MIGDVIIIIQGQVDKTMMASFCCYYFFFVANLEQ